MDLSTINRKYLIYILDHLPGPIVQALICINNLYNKKVCCPYYRYLIKYNTKKKEYEQFDKCKKIIFTTYDITIDLMCKNKFGKEAYDLLIILSYFKPESLINLKLLNEIYDIDLLNQVLFILESYSLIAHGKKTLTINAYLQELLRHRVLTTSGSDAEIEYLKRILKLYTKKDDIENDGDNLNQVRYIWKYTEKYNEKLMEYRLLVGLNLIITYLNNDYDYGTIYTFIQDMYLFIDTRLIIDDIKFYKGLVTILFGKLLIKHKKYENAFVLLDSVLDDFKDKHNVTYLNTKLLMGHVLYSLNKYREAIKIYKEVYDMEKNDETKIFIQDCIDIVSDYIL